MKKVDKKIIKKAGYRASIKKFGSRHAMRRQRKAGWW